MNFLINLVEFQLKQQLQALEVPHYEFLLVPCYSELARQNCLKLISNNNIDSSCLSKRKLHLNKKGLAKLAMNIKNHIHETDVN